MCPLRCDSETVINLLIANFLRTAILRGTLRYPRIFLFIFFSSLDFRRCCESTRPSLIYRVLFKVMPLWCIQHLLLILAIVVCCLFLFLLFIIFLELLLTLLLFLRLHFIKLRPVTLRINFSKLLIITVLISSRNRLKLASIRISR